MIGVLRNKMIKISKRAKQAPFSPIRKLSTYAERAEERGIDVYHLNIGQSNLETPKIFFDEIKKFPRRTLCYAPSHGYKKVRQAWQKYYKQYGINFNLDEIIVTTGGSEAIIFAFLSIADPGDEIIVFEPLYPNYITFSQMASVKLVPITLKIENNFHLPAKEKIIRKISKKTRGILVCSPNNPTGAVYSRQELQMVVDIAKKYKLFIISDEVYREFVFDHKKHISLMNFPEIKNQVILVDSVSKRFNICGARIGCLASKNKEIMQAALKFAQGRLSSPTLEQLAVIPLLRNSRQYIKPFLKEFQKCRQIVINNLCNIKKTFCLKPEGTFYYMTRLPVRSTEKFCQWLLEKFHLDKKTVMFAPGPGFYVTKGLGQDEIRIAYVVTSKELEKAMNILKKSLEAHHG